MGQRGIEITKIASGERRLLSEIIFGPLKMLLEHQIHHMNNPFLLRLKVLCLLAASPSPPLPRIATQATVARRFRHAIIVKVVLSAPAAARTAALGPTTKRFKSDYFVKMQER